MNREFRFQDSSNKCVSIYDKSFGSPAIGERYERHMSELLKVLVLLQLEKDMKDI